jgi:hypothetical protein
VFREWGRTIDRLTLCLLCVQVGDGSTTNRYTPVAVVGLSSGVAMVAVGGVRLFGTCCVAVACVRAGDVNLIDWVADAAEGFAICGLSGGDEGACDVRFCRCTPVRCRAAALCRAGDTTIMAR